jgi:hypothetical protein
MMMYSCCCQNAEMLLIAVCRAIHEFPDPKPEFSGTQIIGRQILCYIFGCYFVDPEIFFPRISVPKFRDFPNARSESYAIDELDTFQEASFFFWHNFHSIYTSKGGTTF